MEFADFFEMDRLSEHDEEQLIESAMQLQQVMLLYQSRAASRPRAVSSASSNGAATRSPCSP